MTWCLYQPASLPVHWGEFTAYFCLWPSRIFSTSYYCQIVVPPKHLGRPNAGIQVCVFLARGWKGEHVGSTSGSLQLAWVRIEHWTKISDHSSESLRQDVPQKPVSSPTAKQLASLLNEADKATGPEESSMIGRVSILKRRERYRDMACEEARRRDGNPNEDNLVENIRTQLLQ
jgi:hypothetical protein